MISLKNGILVNRKRVVPFSWQFMHNEVISSLGVFSARFRKTTGAVSLDSSSIGLELSILKLFN